MENLNGKDQSWKVRWSVRTLYVLTARILILRMRSLMPVHPRDTPAGSPCVGRCTATSLGDAICRGCGRTAEEVRDWNTYSDKQKIAINDRLRKARSDK